MDKRGYKRKHEVEKDENVDELAPRDMNISEFVAARADEMNTMLAACSRVQSKPRAMQQLPRHMRRRAASHNIRRLPRRIRNVAQRETVNNEPVHNKRPSRKHRRRPRHLLAEYQRRQRCNVWLETHIWHAKRFHMIDCWNYKIADHPNSKSFRLCHRAVNEYCMMWDMSYLCCIEIEGTQSVIVAPLQRMMSSDTGLTVAAKAYLDGTRHASVMLYQSDKYPYNAIGPCSFLWKPLVTMETEQDITCEVRKLWLWVNPACYDQVLEQLSIVFDAQKHNDSGSDQKAKIVKNNNEKAEIAKEQIKHNDENVQNTAISNGKSDAKTTKNVTGMQSTVNGSSHDCGDENGFRVNPVYKSAHVTIRSLKDELCRLRLSGAGCHRVLSRALHTSTFQLSNGTVINDNSIQQQCDRENVANNSDIDSSTQELPWWKQYYSSHYQQQHAQQVHMWQQLQRLAAPGSVRQQSVLALCVKDPRLFVPRKISSLAKNDNAEYSVGDVDNMDSWSAALSDSALWQQQVQANVKHTKMAEHQLNEKRSEMLVPGTVPNLGVAESQLPILLLHHANGPRGGWDIVLPAGWGMAFWVALVYGGAIVGGQQQLRQVAAEMRQLHFVTDFPDTPAGRQSDDVAKDKAVKLYDKRPPAKRVNYTKLGTAAHAFQAPWLELLRQCGSEQDDFYVLRSRKMLRKLSQAVNTCNADVLCGLDVQSVDVSSSNSSAFSTSSCLVAVCLEGVKRGLPSTLAAICLPSDKDLEALASGNSTGPVEQIHNVSSKPESSATVIQCSHKTIGYVTQGNFSLSEGRGVGIGFVALSALQLALEQQRQRKIFHVLVRGIAETSYRFYKVQILC